MLGLKEEDTKGDHEKTPLLYEHSLEAAKTSSLEDVSTTAEECRT
jgi:hypothetical protein